MGPQSPIQRWIQIGAAGVKRTLEFTTKIERDRIWERTADRPCWSDNSSPGNEGVLIQNRFRVMSRHSFGGVLPRPISVRGSNFSNSNFKQHCDPTPRRNSLASKTHRYNETHALSITAMRPVPLAGRRSQQQRTKATKPQISAQETLPHTALPADTLDRLGPAKRCCSLTAHRMPP